MKLIIFTLAVFLLSNPIFAFDLFNPERGKPPAAFVKKPSKFPSGFKPKSPKQTIQTSPLPKKKWLPQKNFTLLGTSRIGNKRSVILRGPDRKDFLLRFKNKRTPIKDYEGYYLLKVEARDILIEYPEDAPCRKSNEKKGIICSADEKTATASLKRGKAITPMVKPQAVKPSTQRSRQPKKHTPRKSYKRFRKKVIKPENVPPGMRILHTPFGDRLVPIK